MSTPELSGQSAADQDPTAQSTRKPPPRDGGKFSLRRLDYGNFLTRYGLVVAWVVEIIIFSILLSDIFLNVRNFQTIFGSQAVLLILTLALLLPLAAGELDLSVAGVLGVSVVLVGYLNVLQGWPIGFAIAIALLAGLIIGLLHVLFIVILDLNSIVVTLGTGTILIGLGFGINSLAIGGVSHTLVSITRDKFLGIQIAFFIGLAFTVIIWYVFSYTPLGRYLYFTGANRDVARLAGINVSLVRAVALVSASVMAAIAGVVFAGVLGASDPTAGATFLLPVFAGAFLGATAITPGRFNAWGTFVAVYFLVTGITGLELLGFSGWIERVFYGGSLLLAVTFAQVAGKRLGKTII